MLLLAVHWSRLDDVLKQAGNLSGKVVVTCSLPMNANDTDLVVAHISSGAEVLAKMVPRAKVVTAFGTVPSEVLFDVFEGRSRTKGQEWTLNRGPIGDQMGSPASTRPCPLSASAPSAPDRPEPDRSGSPIARRAAAKNRRSCHRSLNELLRCRQFRSTAAQ